MREIFALIVIDYAIISAPVIVLAGFLLAVAILGAALLLFRRGGKSNKAAKGASQQRTPGGWNSQGNWGTADSPWGQGIEQQPGGWGAQSQVQQPGGWGTQSPQQPGGWSIQGSAAQQANPWGAQSPQQALPLGQASPPRPATSPQTAPRIFVSHSSKDDDFGGQLVQDLRRALGEDSAVWYDTKGGLTPGDPWFLRIEKAIIACNIFLIILSPNAMNSDWIRREFDIALNERKAIIPVLYRACEIWPYLRTVQYVSFLPPMPYPNAFNELLQALRPAKH